MGFIKHFKDDMPANWRTIEDDTTTEKPVVEIFIRGGQGAGKTHAVKCLIAGLGLVEQGITVPLELRTDNKTTIITSKQVYVIVDEQI